MERECMRCHRRAKMPGYETKEGISHGFCPKCDFCIELAKRAEDNDMSLSEFLDEEPGLKEQVMNGIAKDAANWEGDWKGEVDPTVEALYRAYERKARRLKEGTGEIKRR